MRRRWQPALPQGGVELVSLAASRTLTKPQERHILAPMRIGAKGFCCFVPGMARAYGCQASFSQIRAVRKEERPTECESDRPRMRVSS